MSRLHVWVDLMDFPLGNVTVIGLVARCLLVTGAFSTRKWPVAPESDMACFTDLVILAVSQIAVDCGNSCKLFACSICCHAVVRVGMVGVGGRIFGSGTSSQQSGAA